MAVGGGGGPVVIARSGVYLHVADVYNSDAGLRLDHEATSVAILDRASEGGIDFIDTSDAYPLGGDLTTQGRTEEILGRWLNGKRDRFILATKCFGRTGPAAFDVGNSRRHIMQAIEASLRRLGVDPA